MSVETDANKRVSAPFVDAAKKATPSVVSIKAQLKPSRLDRIQEQAREFFHDDFWERFFGAPPSGRRPHKPEPQYGFGS